MLVCEELKGAGMTQKILICDVHGGFGLSREALHRLRDQGHALALAETDVGEMYADGSGPRGETSHSFLRAIPRDDPALLALFEKMGQDAASPMAHFQLVEIPDDVEWQIEEYDGAEWVAEQHLTWGG